MTTREIRWQFKQQIAHQDGVYCTYCKQRKPAIALSRVHESIYKGQCRDTVLAVCTDAVCIGKAYQSHVVTQWKRWQRH